MSVCSACCSVEPFSNKNNFTFGSNPLSIAESGCVPEYTWFHQAILLCTAKKLHYSKNENQKYRYKAVQEQENNSHFSFVKLMFHWRHKAFKIKWDWKSKKHIKQWHENMLALPDPLIPHSLQLNMNLRILAEVWNKVTRLEVWFSFNADSACVCKSLG